jgi:hypothetical protein
MRILAQFILRVRSEFADTAEHDGGTALHSAAWRGSVETGSGYCRHSGRAQYWRRASFTCAAPTRGAQWRTAERQ